MGKPTIYKSKWYLLRLTDNTLLISAGVFDTESAARKAAVAGNGVTPIRGEEVIRRMVRLQIRVA